MSENLTGATFLSSFLYGSFVHQDTVFGEFPVVFITLITDELTADDILTDRTIPR